MYGRVVAGETGFFLNVSKIPAACLLQVTQAALFRKGRVRRGERPLEYIFWPPCARCVKNHAERDQRHSDGKPEAPRPQPMRAREVIHVDALGEGFGRAVLSQHVST